MLIDRAIDRATKEADGKKTILIVHSPDEPIDFKIKHLLVRSHIWMRDVTKYAALKSLAVDTLILVGTDLDSKGVALAKDKLVCSKNPVILRIV